MSTVLVVDDQERLRKLLVRMLASDGHRPLAAADAREALRRLSEEPVDLVLLDLLMPGTNGLQVLAELRQRLDTTPVIVLSAVGEVGARVKALDMGAIDFVAKPFSAPELLARVRRHLPVHTVEPDVPEVLEAGPLRLDLERRRARLEDLDVDLTERETALLAHLVRHRGRVCRRADLLRDVWGIEHDPGSNLVEVCVRRLRGKLAALPIETVRGVGYTLEEG